MLGVKAVFRFLFLCLSISLSLSERFSLLVRCNSNKETKKERKMNKKGREKDRSEESVDARAQRYVRVYRTTGAYVEIRPCPNWACDPCHS